MKISNKIIIGSSFLVALAMVNAIIGFNGLATVNSAIISLDDTVEDVEKAFQEGTKLPQGIGWDINAKNIASTLPLAMLQHRRFEKDYFVNIGNPAKQSSYLNKFRKTQAEMSKNLTLLEKMLLEDEDLKPSDIKVIQSLQVDYHAYTNGFESVTESLSKMDDASPQKANKLMVPYKKKRSPFGKKS